MILTHFDNTGTMITYIWNMPMPTPLRFGFLAIILGLIIPLVSIPLFRKFYLPVEFFTYPFFGGLVIFLISLIVSRYTDPIEMFGYGY